MSSLEDKLLGSINKPEKDATDTAAKPAAKKPAAKNITQSQRVWPD